MKQERLAVLAMLSIEKWLVQGFQQFNELVIDKFATLKERRMDFTLKHCN